MFGYVTPFKMELKIKDYEKFKAYYCGLCHEIKSNFGDLPRMSLNYDMTFIAVLFDALSSDKTIYEPFKCALHPTKKKIKAVVFDRGGYLYTGRVQALADGAREAGLEF